MTITTVKRFTLDEYHRLADCGFLTENDRVELIRGDIYHFVFAIIHFSLKIAADSALIGSS